MKPSKFTHQIASLILLLAGAVSLGWVSFNAPPLGPTPLWSVNLPGRWAVEIGGAREAQRVTVIVEPDGSDGFSVRREDVAKGRGTHFRLVRVAGRDYLVLSPLAAPMLFQVVWDPTARSVQLEGIDEGKITALVEIGTLRIRKFREQTRVLEDRATIERMLADGSISFNALSRATRIDP